MWRGIIGSPPSSSVGRRRRRWSASSPLPAFCPLRAWSDAGQPMMAALWRGVVLQEVVADFRALFEASSNGPSGRQIRSPLPIKSQRGRRFIPSRDWHHRAPADRRPRRYHVSASLLRRWIPSAVAVAQPRTTVSLRCRSSAPAFASFIAVCDSGLIGRRV